MKGRRYEAKSKMPAKVRGRYIGKVKGKMAPMKGRRYEAKAKMPAKVRGRYIGKGKGKMAPVKGRRYRRWSEDRRHVTMLAGLQRRLGWGILAGVCSGEAMDAGTWRRCWYCDFADRFGCGDERLVAGDEPGCGCGCSGWRRFGGGLS